MTNINENESNIDGYAMSTVTGDIGVYAVSGIDTGKCYVGSAVKLDVREKAHSSALKHNRHFNRPLQSAYQELSRDGIEFVVLERTNEVNKLPELEQRFINQFDAENCAFNIRLTVPKKHAAGYKLSEITRRRQSLAKRGRPIEKTCARRYRFKTPAGEIVETLGLRSLAEKHGLSISRLSKLARGHIKSYRGFTRADSSSEASAAL